MKSNKVRIYFFVTALSAGLAVPLISQSASKDKITSDFLTSGNFHYSCLICDSTLVFRTDGNYVVEYGSEGSNWKNDGTYEIKGDRVFLHPKTCTDTGVGEQADCSASLGEAVCTLKKNNVTLDYYMHLVCKSSQVQPGPSDHTISFPIADAVVKEGEKRQVKNVPVIAMGMKRGSTTTQVKIRETPSVGGAAVPYTAELFGGEALPAVPENTSLLILARTVTKQKVQKWNNYWYYVSVGTHEGVWMFGEFVSFE